MYRTLTQMVLNRHVLVVDTRRAASGSLHVLQE